MKMKLHKFLILALVFILLASLTSFVSFGEEEVLTAARPKDGGTLNPIKATASAVNGNVNLFYNQLVAVDPSKDFKVVPSLLSSWETEDFKTWTFHVRKGVTFHDGSPWNSEALKFNLDMWAENPETSYMVFQGIAESIEIVNEYTVKVELTESTPLLMSFLQAQWYSIINPNAVEKHATEDDPYASDWLTSHEAGTGPFVLESWEPDDELDAKKWDQYWGGVIKKTPEIDKLNYLVVPEASVRKMMLEKGDIDVTTQLNRDMYDSLSKSDKAEVKGFATSSRRTMIFYDITSPPFEDLNVRKAISYAINYKQIVESIEGGEKYAAKLTGIPPAGFLGGSAQLKDFYTYDPEKAKQLLKKSDYPDGFETVLMYSPERYTLFNEYALAIQSYLRQIGIDVTIQKVTLDNQLAKQEKGDYGMGLMIYTGGSLALSADAVRWQYCSHKDTYGWRGNHWVSDLTENFCPQAISTPDEDKRAEMYKKIDKVAHEKAIYTYLTQPKTLYALQKDVKEFYSSPPYSEWWWQVRKSK